MPRIAAYTLAVLVLAVAAIMFRYELVVARLPDITVVYQVDRWTGNIRVIQGRQRHPVRDVLDSYDKENGTP